MSSVHSIRRVEVPGQRTRTQCRNISPSTVCRALSTRAGTTLRDQAQCLLVLVQPSRDDYPCWYNPQRCLLVLVQPSETKHSVYWCWYNPQR